MDRLAVIAAEAQRLAEVVAGVDPATRCPTCPDWTVADLLWHVIEVHTFWGAILADRVTDAAELANVEQSKPSRPDTVPEMLGLRARMTARLIEQLEKRDDAERCWSWWPDDQTVGFTRRMQTYEATMHRVDAELAAGVTVNPIAVAVAEGAIDHAVDVMWGAMPGGARYTSAGVVEFVAVDTGRRWQVEVGRWADDGGAESAPTEGARATRAGVGEPTATAAARTVDLALWAWTRGGVAQTDGDGGTLAALDAVVTQGM
ncbi:maleylpyruvate isomerase family mycothiol-dependent enzyme [Gordonia sp. CPCC 206044]|uniref:maleylpyruvate isomerase family mycothiol-dependent enzyme n=1 Tax=Gordonia sp. CPCC 206044 TaxID=3140793 RepID=UPI003AF3A089